MRTLSLALAGALALASASAANAAVTIVTPPTDVNAQAYNSPDSALILYNQAFVNTAKTSFSNYLTFHNDTPGMFNLSALTTAIGGTTTQLTFTTLTLSGPFMGSPLNLLDYATSNANGSTSYAYNDLFLGVGDFTLNFAGYAPKGTTGYGGQVTFSALAGGVPEPATWGLMLLGFGLMGSSMRRRRARTAVAQLA